VSSGRGKKVVKTRTINKPAEELYRYWRRLENLPTFSRHLVSVRQTSNRDSHWVAKSPTGTVEWDAVIINEHENEMIAWESTADSPIKNAGSVRFEPAPGGQGTEVRVSLEYEPPGGKVGAVVTKIFGEEPEKQVEDDLNRFKELMEAGRTDQGTGT
jgi:uncharacterized membrane protein